MLILTENEEIINFDNIATVFLSVETPERAVITRKKTEDITLKNGRKKIYTKNVEVADINILHSNVNYV